MPLLDEYKKARLETLRDEIVNAAKAGNHEQTMALAEGDELEKLRSQDMLDRAIAMVRDVRAAAKEAKDPERTLLRVIVANLLVIHDSAMLSNLVRDAKRRALEIRIEALEAKLSGTSSEGLKLAGAEQVPVNDEKVMSFEQRLKALEGSRSMEYAGTFEADRSYRKGQVVTFKNSLWVVKSPEASDCPPSKNWQMCARRDFLGGSK